MYVPYLICFLFYTQKAQVAALFMFSMLHLAQTLSIPARLNNFNVFTRNKTPAKSGNIVCAGKQDAQHTYTYGTNYNVERSFPAAFAFQTAIIAGLHQPL